VAQLKTKMLRVELAYWDRAAQTSRSVREHAAIITALQKGSRRGAIAALKQNWEGSMERLRSLPENQTESPQE
jgi:DNA-binding GntR family transcriptional regulator